MEIIDCNNFKGWFVGSFQPNILESNNIEVGYKRIEKNTKPDYHFHKYKTEYTILLEGKIYSESKKKTIEPVTCIKLLPYERNDQLFLEDSLILVINTPSAINDKHF